MKITINSLEWGPWKKLPPYLSWRDAKEMRIAETEVGVYKLLYRPLISRKQEVYDRLLHRGKWFVETATGKVIGPFDHDVQAAQEANKFHREYVTNAIQKLCKVEIV